MENSNDFKIPSKEINTVGELKEYLIGLPDNLKVYLWDVGIGGTVYRVEVEVDTKECIEHSGKRHTKHGLMIQVNG